MTSVHKSSRTRVPAYEVGRILPKFVTPADVRDLKVRVDAFVRATDKAVTDCPKLPEGQRSGWNAFSKAWRSYFDEDDSWWHSAAQMDQGEAYEADLARWQDLIAHSQCAETPPSVSPSSGGAPNEDRWQATVRTVAIAGAVIAVALGVRAVLK